MEGKLFLRAERHVRFNEDESGGVSKRIRAEGKVEVCEGLRSHVSTNVFPARVKCEFPFLTLSNNWVPHVYVWAVYMGIQ